MGLKSLKECTKDSNMPTCKVSRRILFFILTDNHWKLKLYTSNTHTWHMYIQLWLGYKTVVNFMLLICKILKETRFFLVFLIGLS